MATKRLKLTRDQLAAFLGKDAEAIKQFEALFATTDELSTSVQDELTISAINAEARAQQAIDALNRLSDVLESLALAPVIRADNSLVTDYIDLPDVAAHTTLPRRMQWNQDDGTLDVGLYGGAVLQAGQETLFYSKNTSGGSIAIGTPVMFTGTVGASGKLTFGLAIADGSVSPDYMMGVTAQTIANNDYGYVTSFGAVRGFNTTGSPYGETWADGDLLYFDAAAPGTWTNVQPSAPSIAVPVAVVIHASAGSGSIFVRMKISERLNELQDVHITGSPANGQILVYNATTTRWENANVTAGSNIAVTNGAGSVTIGTTAAITADLTNNTGRLVDSSVNLTDGSAANTATLTNAPATGNPTKWISIDDNGTTRYVPAW